MALSESAGQRPALLRPAQGRDDRAYWHELFGSLEVVHFFLVTARCGCFMQAARSLDVKPTLLRKTLARLEERLGLHLFVHEGNALSLTREGRIVQAAGQRLVEDSQSHADLHRQQPLVRLAVAESVLHDVLSRELWGYLRKNANLRVALAELREGWPESAGPAEIAIWIADPGQPHPPMEGHFAAPARIAELEAENAEIQRTLDSSEARGYGGKRGSGGTRQDPWGQIFTRDWFKAVRGGGLQNVEFRTRDFEQTARPVMNGEQVRLVNGRLQSLIHLLRADGIDDLGIGQLLVLTQFASHHQKMVLVDYGSPQAIGFVMGHNMHRNYWDTSAHLFDDRAAGRDPGFGPWQDISMQVQGPVLADLSRNFSEAWDLETPWYKRWFSTPSLTAERDALPLPKIATPTSNSVAQICRTQPQDDERSILEHYLKALGNATDYVYMENQYFRYAGFAERLRKTAQVRKARGVPGDLYLFVVTNTPDSSDASKTTYDMMKGLGQEQLMPQVQRDLAHDLREKREQLKQVRENLHPDPYVRRGQENNIERLERKIEALEEKGVTPEVEQRLGGLGAQEIPGLAKNTGEDDKPYQLAEVPGLKVVVATLATSDPAPGSPPPGRLSAEAEAALGAPPQKARYKHIYVHSKLLLVDDLYTLLSSANINVRSMHGDSELGIAQPNPDLARAMREELWELHAQKVAATTEKNFKLWNQKMDANWRQQRKDEPLVANLLRFWDVVTPYSPGLTVD